MMRRGRGRVRGIAGSVLLLAWLACARVARAGDLVLVAPEGEGLALARSLAEGFAGRLRLANVRLESAAEGRECLRRAATGEDVLAVVRGDLLYDVAEGRGEYGRRTPDLRALALLRPLPLLMLGRGKPGDSGVTGLGGARVWIDPAGAATAHRLLLALGLSSGSSGVSRCDRPTAFARLAAGDLHLLVLAASAPGEDIAAALRAGAAPVPVEPAVAARLVRERPDLRRADLAASAWGLPADVPTLETSWVLACHSALPVDVAREATEVARATLGFEPARAAETPIPLHPGAAAAFDAWGANPYPVKVLVGVYAYSISELDTVEGTFLLDGYVWFRWQGRMFGETEGPFDFSVVNGTVEHIDEGTRVIRQGGWSRQSRRLTVRLRGRFDLGDYPFDRQVLPLEIEHRWQGEEKLVFVPDDEAVRGDLRSSFLAGSVAIADWTIGEVRHRAETKQYETDFGSIDKDEWQGKSSRYVFTVEIRRSVLRYAVKLLLPLLVAVAMGFIVFWIHPMHFEAKTCLGILALLDCIGLHIAHGGHLAEAGYVVKADLFFLDAYLMICLSMVQMVYENRLHLAGQDAAAERLMRLCRWAFPIGFLLPILWIFLTS